MKIKSWRVKQYEAILAFRQENGMARSPMLVAQLVAAIPPVVEPWMVLAEVAKHYDFTN